MSNPLHRLLRQKEKWDFVKGDLTETAQEFKNPARGWYRIYTYMANQSPDFSHVVWGEDCPDTMALIIINIGAYKECAIEPGALDNIRSVLAFFAQKQFDIILRVTYDHEGKALEREPFFFKQVQEHMYQIAPMVKEFSDNIFVYQGMLVGNWGEMHTSRFLDPLKLKELWGILQTKGSDEVFYAVRKPAQWRMLHPDCCCKKQFDCDRMGLFDDAILGSESHLGTFGTVGKSSAGWEDLWAREDELAFEEMLCRKVPNGGEAIYGELYAKPEEQATISSVMRSMHITYLNRDYDKKVLNLWKQWKCTEQGPWMGKSFFDYVGNHLGYRFLVKDVDVKLTSRKERMFEVSITIENVGFANLYQETELFFEWVYGNGERYLKKLDFDLRSINSGTASVVRFKIPASDCELYLFARRKKDSRKIIFANRIVGKSRIKLGEICNVKLN